jgi:hypothetical protein
MSDWLWVSSLHTLMAKSFYEKQAELIIHKSGCIIIDTPGLW